jgi:hypothetical protein
VVIDDPTSVTYAWGFVVGQDCRGELTENTQMRTSAWTAVRPALSTGAGDLTVLASYTATFGGYQTEEPSTATGPVLPFLRVSCAPTESGHSPATWLRGSEQDLDGQAG